MSNLLQHGAPQRQGERGYAVAIVTATTWPFDVRVSVDPALLTLEAMRNLGRKMRRALISALTRQARLIAAAGEQGVAMAHGIERFSFANGRAEYGFRIDPHVVTPEKMKKMWGDLRASLLELLPIQKQLAGRVSA